MADRTHQFSSRADDAACGVDGAGVKAVALIIGRLSDGAHGLVVGHITPAARRGSGTLTIVQDGDETTIDAESKQLTPHVNILEIARRFEKWQASAPRYARGVLAKYDKLVSSASKGAVADNLD